MVDAARLRRLTLNEFRVYRNLELAIGDGGLRIVGPNGSGKTSFIEALLLLSTTRSRRGVHDADLIHHESGVELASRPYARVRGEIEMLATRVELDIFIERTEANKTRKLLRVSDVPRKAADVVGLFPTVSFSPEDLDLVVGSPSRRRRFLDVLLSQVDREYLRHLSRFGRMISHRNSLLKSIASGQGQRNELQFWDEQIVALGAYLIAARVTAVHAMGQYAEKVFRELATFDERLTISYASTIDQPQDWWDSVATTSQDVRAISQRIGVVLEAQMRDAEHEDIARGVTTIGPHRDDLDLRLGDREILRFGSRGQQRLAIIAMKLAEIDFISSKVGALPALLLDDVLSELDATHRSELLRRIGSSNCQMFVTATEREMTDVEWLSGLGLEELTAPGTLRRT